MAYKYRTRTPGLSKHKVNFCVEKSDIETLSQLSDELEISKGEVIRKSIRLFAEIIEKAKAEADAIAFDNPEKLLG